MYNAPILVDYSCYNYEIKFLNHIITYKGPLFFGNNDLAPHILVFPNMKKKLHCQTWKNINQPLTIEPNFKIKKFTL